jgi:hypothetical protein
MERRPTSRKNNATRSTDISQLRTKTAKDDPVIIEINTSAHGVDDRLGLLKNLFLHEMGVASLKIFGMELY